MANISLMDYPCLGRGRTTVNMLLICLTFIVSVIGSVGNVLSVKVFSSKKFSSPKTEFLIYLAIVDIIALGLNGFTDIPLLLDPDSDLQDTLPVFVYIYIIAHNVVLLELYVTVVIAIQRVICVVLPFKASVLITKITNRILFTVLILMCLCLMGVHLAGVQLIPWSPDLNDTLLMEGAPFTREQGYVIFVYFRLFGIRIFIPVVAITVCSVVIVCRMNRKDKISGNSARYAKRQRLTVLCLIISVMSVLTNIFAILVFCLFYFDIISQYECGPLGIIATLLVSVNMSVNFMVYGFSGKAFRKAATDSCSCLKPPQSSRDTSAGNVWYSHRFDNINIEC